MLIVLDNCEHLIEPVAALVQTILERCPRVRILATSREALAVPGEVQLPVAPLPVPDRSTAAERVAEFRRPGCSWTARPRCRPDLTLDGADA